MAKMLQLMNNWLERLFLPFRVIYLVCFILLCGCFSGGGGSGSGNNVIVPVNPNPPDNLKLFYSDDRSDGITLTWSPVNKYEDGTPLMNLKGYNVYRQVETCDGVFIPYVKIATILSGLHFVDRGVFCGKYEYFVRTLVSSGFESSNSSIISYTTNSSLLLVNTNKTNINDSPFISGLEKNQYFDLYLFVENVRNLFTANLEIKYDPNLLEILSVSYDVDITTPKVDNFLIKIEADELLGYKPIVNDIKEEGILQVMASRDPNNPKANKIGQLGDGVTGSGFISRITFATKNLGRTSIEIIHPIDSENTKLLQDESSLLIDGFYSFGVQGIDINIE